MGEVNCARESYSSSSRILWLSATIQLFYLLSSCGSTTSVRTKLVENVTNPAPSSSPRPVQLIEKRDVTIDNGIFQVTFSKPEGKVLVIKYNNIANLLEWRNDVDDRGYWDVVWYEPGKKVTYDKLPGTKFTVINQSDDIVELSFSRNWTTSDRGKFCPLNVDLRYIVRRGVSGFYAYAIMERENGWPDIDMDQIRIVFKPLGEKFTYMAVSDDRQRFMPTFKDRLAGKALLYPEAVVLSTVPSIPDLKGEVDDKYQYSLEDKDNTVHGWISSNPPTGLWMITPSDEFRGAGPVKQELTSHAGPIMLNMFTSLHYSGKEINTAYRNGEPWKKVFGPFFLYINSLSDSKALWEDAKKQMSIEVGSWPYNFTKSADFPKKEQRGTVSGQLTVDEKFIGDKMKFGKAAYVGLALPGEVGSWQKEAKGYQFWTQANNEGNFVINNVRPGNYSLYAWVPGVIGDYMYDQVITITEGCDIKLNTLVFKPPRNGPTLWEIGYPDRSAAEYFIPDTFPAVMNNLYKTHADKFRQYGLWDKYSEIYPSHDLVFTVGVSDYKKDWFFTQATRKIGKEYKSTTWQVVFNLDNVTAGNYTLQMALASANYAEIQIRFNDEFNAEKMNRRRLMTTGLIGLDNAIARHGIHGIYRLFSFSIDSERLVEGKNTLYLTQAREVSPFKGVMYDYIRLEGPPPDQTPQHQVKEAL
ncbi:hypothetical protein ACFE04_016605 [Oxalis oulophora]